MDNEEEGSLESEARVKGLEEDANKKSMENLYMTTKQDESVTLKGEF